MQSNMTTDEMIEYFDKNLHNYPLRYLELEYDICMIKLGFEETTIEEDKLIRKNLPRLKKLIEEKKVLDGI